MQIAAETVTESPVSPLTGLQISRLQQALEGLTPEQLNWASGYLAGRADHVSRIEPAVIESQAITILYATHGGNARSVAESLAANATKRGFSPRLLSVDEYRPRDIGKEKLLIIAISTQGEGEPPESARELFKYLSSNRAAALPKLKYAVFGLGDSSYEYFCKAAKDLDRLLQQHGAHNLVERVDADVDFETLTPDWNRTVLKHLEELFPADQARIIPIQASQASVQYDRNHPYPAALLERRRITTDDAVSEVHHLAMEIDTDAIQYLPGDALGLYFRNSPELIDEILARTELSGDAGIDLRGETLPLSQALCERLELTQLHPSVAKAWASHTNSDQLNALSDDSEKLRRYCHERQFVDLLTEYPASVGANELVDLLHTQQPRLYSIASSQSAYEDEIHLTVSTLRYRTIGREHLGGASGYLTRHINEGDNLGIYIAENGGFRLPKDGDTPIIMIGAGTGVAPYRAFLQEREALGSQGRNWLFFGSRHFHRDFLYQADWIKYRKDGLLNRISVAFSRENTERIYVQNRILDEGAELHAWLQDGAHLYVCGGLEMEKAVYQSLKEVLRVHGGVNAETAGERIESLRSQGRYLRDVY
ncbi:MAG: flavodoxin domain-containing protein [Candidatus Thiodiazotropha sp. (ex Monitilora ramsayi)]|nr:flavodoxin domain-containing protein [Candidatus Thiodiazotropha sp. (ex Monitilora ramsayi)]